MGRAVAPAPTSGPGHCGSARCLPGPPALLGHCPPAPEPAPPPDRRPVSKAPSSTKPSPTLTELAGQSSGPWVPTQCRLPRSLPPGARGLSPSASDARLPGPGAVTAAAFCVSVLLLICEH